MGRFLTEQTETKSGGLCPVSSLHKRFIEWADENGENRMSSRALGEALSERGIKKIKKPDGWKFTGIDLKPKPIKEIYGGYYE